MRKLSITLVVAVGFALFVGVGWQSAARAQESLFACSPNDTAQGCLVDADCPEGACIRKQFVCLGGARNERDCECPGSTCERASGADDLYICAGGLTAGRVCTPGNGCPNGGCLGTVQVCFEGSRQGQGCHTDCPDGSACVPSLEYCADGPRARYGCIEEANCGSMNGVPYHCRGPVHHNDVGQLCSGGSNDGDVCEDHPDCGSGACVRVATICDGGGEERDGQPCDVPGDCGGANCLGTHRICDGDDDGGSGTACARDEHCSGGTCVSTGKFCDGEDGNIPCNDDAGCPEGVSCVSPTPAAPGNDDDGCAVVAGNTTAGGGQVLLLGLLAMVSLRGVRRCAMRRMRRSPVASGRKIFFNENAAPGPRGGCRFCGS